MLRSRTSGSFLFFSFFNKDTLYILDYLNRPSSAEGVMKVWGGGALVVSSCEQHVSKQSTGFSELQLHVCFGIGFVDETEKY